MLFFTLPSSQNAAVVSGGGFFSWGTKFKYTGRTEREILTESITALREQRLTNSSTCKRKASSVPATPSSPQSDLAQIRYSSLPRSSNSEFLRNYNLPLTDGLSNTLVSQNVVYGLQGNNGLEVLSLDPGSEEARMQLSSNIKNINCTSADHSNFYVKFEDSTLYSPPKSTLFNVYDEARCFSLRTCQNTQSSHHQKQKSKSVTENSNLPTLTTSKAQDGTPCGNQHTNNAKRVRKFHFVNAFIPSFVFVVIAMTISAIVVLESTSDLLEQIRNLPEMISLRYQYYQPLKKYILEKVGHNI